MCETCVRNVTENSERNVYVFVHCILLILKPRNLSKVVRAPSSDVLSICFIP